MHPVIFSVRMPRCVPNASPDTAQNPPHVLRPSVVKRHHIPSLEPSFEVNPPHFPPVERDPSPPLYLPIPVHDSDPPSPPFCILTPICDSRPRPETPSMTPPHIDNAFILQIFDCIILSPSWRHALAGLIDAINRLNLDDNIPALQKIVEPLRKRFRSLIPTV
ncbi:hypothetical protein MVEN_02308700 [Mycena venus]|uniref:Uncharacterized protein n=1 Tax=Mycena venus TaxID=2733690 RepID=A0A8H7CFY1_9AGAR|nr:hypothetical protein MVEN_02308700 [Mycena venus]